MNRSRAALVVLLLIAGVVLVASVPYRVWLPTVGNPNYWAGHTGGLLPLVVQAAVGGGLFVAGVALGIDDAVRWLRPVNPRVMGLAGVVGGLLGYGPIQGAVVQAIGARTPTGFYGVGAAALVLLAIATIGLLARYPSIVGRGRSAGGVAVGGFLVLAGAELLRWASFALVPRSGALWYPPLGVELLGTISVAAGSLGLGLAVRGRDAVPRWLGPLLLVVGLLTLPVGVLAFLQNLEAEGFVWLAWVVVGVHLATPAA